MIADKKKKPADGSHDYRRRRSEEDKRLEKEEFKEQLNELHRTRRRKHDQEQG